MALSDFCIINCGFPEGYASISERLDASLSSTDYSGDRIILKNERPPLSPSHQENPYAFKIYLFEHALGLGYKKIMWLDSSFYVVKNPQPLIDYVNKNGFYFFKTGYNLAQSVNDKTLCYANMVRDGAEQITEYASGCVALNFDFPEVRKMYMRWKEYMLAGMFKGSRAHGGQSDDPRFLFHRQDQSCLSLAMFENGIKMKDDPEFVAYYGGDYSHEKLIFFIKGI